MEENRRPNFFSDIASAIVKGDRFTSRRRFFLAAFLLWPIGAFVWVYIADFFVLSPVEYGAPEEETLRFKLELVF